MLTNDPQNEQKKKGRQTAGHIDAEQDAGTQFTCFTST
jgi:hypothetical protein